MKNLFSIYKKDMLRPILYKTVSRLAGAACACLLWQRFLSDGRFTIWEAPCLAVGALFLAWAWVSYLRLDGIRVPFVDRNKEKVVSFEELSPQERAFCSLLSNLILGVPMVAIGLAAGVL